MLAWLRNYWLKTLRHSRSDFASVASHELRTPLSIVKWYSEILLDEDMGPLNDEQKKYLKVIQTSNERAISLVTSLLNVSRLELDTFSVSPEPLLIHSVIEEVLKKQERKIGDKKLSINIDKEGEMLPISLDKGITFFILKTILDNAISYAHESTSVIVMVKQTPALCTVSVRNTGIGVKENEKDFVGTKMWRGSNVPDEEKGAGLGLYMVKILLSKIGGTFFFESKENDSFIATVNIPCTGMRTKKGTTKLESGF